ncbi:hypothetical protein EYF80_050050 [Liparis tanakae]|uniref:Uncharacterized protein n=1 Tax=Liparis tanakae TaxID=230148 RepID=A0A4Z2FFR3_9TELE|nr:hypothetical protein EYF80_050050 [Liparis tanakae]
MEEGGEGNQKTGFLSPAIGRQKVTSTDKQSAWQDWQPAQPRPAPVTDTDSVWPHWGNDT